MGNSAGVQVVGTIATIQTGSEFRKGINDTRLDCPLLMDGEKELDKTESEKAGRSEVWEGRGCPGKVYWLHQLSIFVVV